MDARAELTRESLPPATSLNQAEWALVAPILPAPAGPERPRRWPMRQLFDTILSVLHRLRLPLDFPPWSGVHR